MVLSAQQEPLTSKFQKRAEQMDPPELKESSQDRRMSPDQGGGGK